MPLTYINKQGKEVALRDVEDHPGYKDSDGNLYYLSSNDSKSAALSVFAGKLFREILGEYQPDYHLVFSDKTTYRACDWLDQFEHLEFDKQSPLNVIYKGKSYSLSQVRNLTAAIVAGYFLGEIDWDDGNIGLVPDNDNPDCLVAVRIDPGLSFQYEIEEILNLDNIDVVLYDPIRMIIGGINAQCYKDGYRKTINKNYFSHLFTTNKRSEEEILADYQSDDDSESEEELGYKRSEELLSLLEHLDYRDSELQNLLANQEEIRQVLNTIIILEESTLLELAEDSGLSDQELNDVLNLLLTRKNALESYFYENFGAVTYPSDDELDESMDLDKESDLADSGELPITDYRSIPSQGGIFDMTARKKRKAIDELSETTASKRPCPK